MRLAGVEPATLGLEDEGRHRAGPPSFCLVPRNRALLLEFSLLALRTDKDSRRTRGLKSGALTGSFSANQRKRNRKPLESLERVDMSRGVIRLELTKSGRRRKVPLNDDSDRALVRL